MKNKIIFILIFTLLPNLCMAECDFSTGIVKQLDGSFVYTKECHLRVGQIKQDLEISLRQVGDLTKAIELKDLALQKSDQRVNLWMDTSQKMEDRVIKIDELQNKNQWLMFGLGIVTTLGASYVASQLLRR
jgi:hypothetical protein